MATKDLKPKTGHEREDESHEHPQAEKTAEPVPPSPEVVKQSLLDAVHSAEKEKITQLIRTNPELEAHIEELKAEIKSLKAELAKKR